MLIKIAGCLKNCTMIARAKLLYSRIEPQIPTICFLGGSTWDTLTLRRIDNALDMTIFSCYLILSSIIVVLITRRVTFKFSQHLPSAAQFFFGGLFSGCTVYYFKSTSSLLSFLFLLCLALMLVGNEFLEKKYSNAQITFSFWSICAVMVLNFLIPVLLNTMNAWVFLLSVATALLMCVVIMQISRPYTLSLKPVIAVYSLLIVLFFLNIIPPVPISQKQMHICRSVSHNNGEYTCVIEKPVWYRPFKKVFSYVPGDTVYCFSSVFAPARLRKRIYHHWYFKNPLKNEWIERARIGYTLSGGRDQGYRGFTFKRNVEPGRWKVKLKTDDGKTLGILNFIILPRDTADALKVRKLNY